MDEMMNALPVLWKMILGLCGMIAAIGGAAAILAKVFAPINEMKRRIDALEKLHKDDQKSNEGRFKTDLIAIEQLEESNKRICKCMVALMDHEITGNSIERMKKTRDELNDYLIEK